MFVQLIPNTKEHTVTSAHNLDQINLLISLHWYQSLFFILNSNPVNNYGYDYSTICSASTALSFVPKYVQLLTGHWWTHKEYYTLGSDNTVSAFSTV